MPPTPLPIDAVLPRIVAALRGSAAVVVQAPPGAGKTTRVPPALLDAGLAAGGIVMLEPRRIAARAAARRMSAERGTPPGDAVGWHVRFERQANRNTRILVVTPGILLRRLHDDPFLESTSIVVFDEFHERGLDVDLALGLLRLVQANVRPDLKLVVMSATLEAASVAAYLGDCPVVTSEGRAFPVSVHYRPKRESDRWPEATAKAVADVWSETPGSVLAFLPGVGEIRAAADDLRSMLGDELILPLYGDLSAEEQDRALLPQARRRIVLATNVAETSVTVEGITAVVDTGLARQLVNDASVGLDRLRLVPVSQASADQRAGRAGRTQPGTCVRLWSEVSHRSRPAATEPEVRRIDLAGAVLTLLALGERPETFPWLDAPGAPAVRQAMDLLEQLGATSDGTLTEDGRELAKLPVHPRLARLLIEGSRLGDVSRPALAAAILSERDPFPRTGATHSVPCDLTERLESLGTLPKAVTRPILHARDQLVRLMPSQAEASASANLLGRALLAAFPDRLCRRREPASPRGVMVGGRGVRLAPTSGVRDAELFLALDVDAGQVESLVRMASGVERSWLPSHLVTESVDVEFDEAASKIVAWKRTRFVDLVVAERSAQVPDDDRAATVLADAAARRADRVVPADDSPAGQFRLRVRWLRAWMPELGLPALDDGDVRETLAWLVPGCRTLDEVRRRDWLAAYRGRLTHPQRQAVDREAPERLRVPSGSEIALQYEEGRPPVLAVRVQELFGLPDTPRIAAGRVPVLLHLLAPNHRPQQVTDDLASFWANTYPTVRKELRARYPKHSWPEDPLSAEPTSRARRKPAD